MTGESCLRAANRAFHNFENLYIHCIARTTQQHGFFDAMKAVAFLDLQEIKIKVLVKSVRVSELSQPQEDQHCWASLIMAPRFCNNIQVCMYMTWGQKGNCLGEPGEQKGGERSLGVETRSKLSSIPL